MTILLVGVGIIFSIRFSFRYQWKIAFNFKNTFAKIGAKGEGEGTVSGFRAACTALANTVGTGNISGVATAIVSGGPGALVWMWVSAFFGMAGKDRANGGSGLGADTANGTEIVGADESRSRSRDEIHIQLLWPETDTVSQEGIANATVQNFINILLFDTGGDCIEFRRGIAGRNHGDIRREALCHHLMMAKFIYAYIAESIMEFMILVAVFVGYLLAVGKNIGLAAAFHPISLIGSALGVVLIPLIPMIYCAVFSLILMAGLSGVKSTKVFYRTSTLFLLIFAALFIFSLRGIGEVNMENYVESLGSGDNLFLRSLNIIFFPVPWLAEAISRGNIVMLLLYLVGNAALILLLYYVGKALYQRGLYTAASLGSSKKAEIGRNDIREQSQFRASLFKELRVILRTKAFSGNCAYINILWPVGTWMLFHYTGHKGFLADYIAMYQAGKERAGMIMAIVVISIAFIATALNSLASTAFTREGQHLALLKFIPVPYETQMYAKAAVSFMFTYPMLLLTNLIICYYVGAGILTIL